MANRFISSTGSNTSPYDTWAKAATSLATAITGSSSGDVFVLDAANPGADVAANTTWTFLGNATLIASTNSGTSTITPTTMGTSTYLGSSGATTYALTLAGAFKVYIYGVTFRMGGSQSTPTMNINITDGGHFELENCYIWQGSAGTGRTITGAASAASNNYTLFKNCIFRFGATGQSFQFAGFTDIIGGEVSSAGSAPTTLYASGGNLNESEIFGFDMSLVTNTLVGASSNGGSRYRFVQCKLGSGVTVMATQSPANKSSANVWVFDCASGDSQELFGYYDAFGSCVSNTSIYVTAGAAAQSWQVVTTANCSFGTPFTTPWVNFYNSTLSSMTPRLEILRDGSSTAYTDAEVWGEFSAKVTSGFTIATTYNDRQSLTDWAAGTAGTSQATGAGLGSWSGESGTAWSGKVDTGSAITPAENGYIRGRVVVGAASTTLYVNPQIET